MAGKKYRESKKNIPNEAQQLAAAVEIVKKNAGAKFDETVEVHIRLGVDPSKSDQLVRSSVTLPAGSPKQKKVVVFTENAAVQKAAEEAGATKVGGVELINEIAANGSLDADLTIATPDMMPKVAKVAKVLGPKGLMPNPKTGTVTPDPAAVVKDMLSGKVFFKMDQLGNIHEAVGKASWDAAKLTANAKALLDAVQAARPGAMKGQLIKSVTLKSTMSPGVRVAL